MLDILKNKEFWQSKRGKALIKLVAWFLFFLIIYIVAMANAGKSYDVKPIDDQANKEEINITYNNILKDLLLSNYDYKYKITINNINYVFQGTFNNNINTGFKEDDNGITKYEINDGIIYQINLDEKILNDSLLDGINMDYFNLRFINNIVNNLNKIDENTYSNLIDNIEYTLIIKDNKVNSITIKSNEFLYELEFSNISKVVGGNE